MSRLQYITLWGTQVLDKSLKTLSVLKQLESVHTAQFYSTEEYQYLVDHLPKLKYGNVIELASGSSQKK